MVKMRDLRAGRKYIRVPITPIGADCSPVSNMIIAAVKVQIIHKMADMND
jgi:hypothetical protein